MASNPALDTKVKAMQAHMLSQKDYDSLISAENLAEVVAYLKNNTHYGQYLEDIDPQKASRVDVEAAFSRIIIDNTQKLLYFILGEERDFINLIIFRENLESLQVLLRALAKGEDLKKVVTHLGFSDKFKSKSFDRLIEADTWLGFKEALKNTIYYRSLETYDKLDSTNLFELEKTMERNFYDLLFKRLKELNKNECKDLIKLIRSEIDMLNLIWIYRAKKFYHLSADRIIPFVYRGGALIDLEELYRLAQIEDYTELLEALKSYKPYAFLFNHPEGDIDLHMERRKKRYLYYRFKKLLTFGKAVSAAYSYLRLLQDETDDITSIIEGKRYQMSNEEMTEYLIRSVKE